MADTRVTRDPHKRIGVCVFKITVRNDHHGLHFCFCSAVKRVTVINSRSRYGNSLASLSESDVNAQIKVRPPKFEQSLGSRLHCLSLLTDTSVLYAADKH